MKRHRLLLVLALILLIPSSSTTLAEQAKPADEAKRVVIRGKVVCLDESGSPSAKGDCNASSGRFGLVTGGQKLYTFVAKDTATAMFTDSRVRARELQITALARSRNQLEIIKVHSIKQGKLYDIYYFCEVCNITAYAPGLCSCCREEMEFRETPAPQN